MDLKKYHVNTCISSQLRGAFAMADYGPANKLVFSCGTFIPTLS
jgi:hypothetical protein